VKRDWDLIRTILSEAEAKSPGQLMFDSEISGWPIDEVRGHIDMLKGARFIEAHVLKGSALGAATIVDAHVSELTFKGHDLLDTIRSKTVWEKTKKLAKEKGVELTFDVVKTLGKIALDFVLKGGGDVSA
jgi:hypothetical protein